MEIIAAIAVFLCPLFFILGVWQGKRLREIRTVERVIEAGKVSEEKTTKPVEPTEEEKQLEESFKNLQNYKPKYPGVKE